MKIFALNSLEQIDDVTYRKLLISLPTEQQDRIKKFSRLAETKRALLTDILVRSIIVNELKISNKEIEFNINKYGKPLLERNCDFHFNISHSGDWIVCAVDSQPIGIDIEKIGPVELAIAAQFFSDEEFKMLMAKNFKDQPFFFFDLWTLKESYIKAIGTGVSTPLESFTVCFLEKGEIAVKTGNKLTHWALKQYNLDPQYKMSVCSLHKAFPENIIIKKLKDLFSDIL